MADREKREEDENTKFEYLENEKSFLDEIKSAFYSFWRPIIWWRIKISYKIADTAINNVYTKGTTLTAFFFIEKQRVLPLKRKNVSLQE